MLFRIRRAPAILDEPIVFSACIQQLGDTQAVKLTIDEEGVPLAFSRVLELWEGDAAFREFFTALLSGIPYGAFRWECPAMTEELLDQPFECVVSDSPSLNTHADPSAFASQFERAVADEDVIAFPNLGRDAILVVPRPLGQTGAYGHLGAFVREAPEPQRHELWQCVAAALRRRIGSRPVWLSTAGAGVPWLHVRLDDRPKYYRHAAYRAAG